MNRRVLLGLLIVIGLGLFLHREPQKTKTTTEENFASTSPKKSQQNDSVAAVLKEETAPSQSTPRTGKYSLRIPQSNQAIQAEILKRDQYLAQNKTGLILKSDDQSFVVMKLRAAKEKSTAGRSLGHEMFPIDLLSAQKVIVSDDSYPVVYRESNGRIGLLTGIILIQTSENSEAEKLALNYPMSLQTYDSSIGLASYKVRSGEGLYEIYNQIRQNEKVKSITVEVLDSYKGF